VQNTNDQKSELSNPNSTNNNNSSNTNKNLSPPTGINLQQIKDTFHSE